MRFEHSIHDAMDMAARKVGIADWQASLWKAAGDDSIVEGCVPDGVYARGPKKGRPRFSKPKIGTQKTVVVTRAELDIRAAEYESAEQKCWNCKGTGQTVAGWSKDSGTRYRTCTKCNGDGKPRA